MEAYLLYLLLLGLCVDLAGSFFVSRSLRSTISRKGWDGDGCRSPSSIYYASTDQLGNNGRGGLRYRADLSACRKSIGGIAIALSSDLLKLAPTSRAVSTGRSVRPRRPSWLASSKGETFGPDDFFGPGGDAGTNTPSSSDEGALKGGSPSDDEVYPVVTPSGDGSAKDIDAPPAAAPSDDIGAFEPDEEDMVEEVDTKGLNLGEEGELPREFRTPSNKYTIVDESEVEDFEPEGLPMPGTSCFSLTYDLKPKYVEADLDDIARAQEIYSRKFDRFITSEVISLNASRGVVSLWIGKSDSSADREATIQQIRSFIADDPFIVKNLVEDYTIMDIGPNATEAEFIALNSHKMQASEASLARESFRIAAADGEEGGDSGTYGGGSDASGAISGGASVRGGRDFLSLDDIPPELRGFFDEDVDG